MDDICFNFYLIPHHCFPKSVFTVLIFLNPVFYAANTFTHFVIGRLKLYIRKRTHPPLCAGAESTKKVNQENYKTAFQ